jgi:hypothetical protein
MAHAFLAPVRAMQCSASAKRHSHFGRLWQWLAVWRTPIHGVEHEFRQCCKCWIPWVVSCKRPGAYTDAGCEGLIINLAQGPAFGVAK